jgi:hypothetical protein
MRKVRYLDKLVDAVARGKSMSKVLRAWRRQAPSQGVSAITAMCPSSVTCKGPDPMA